MAGFRSLAALLLLCACSAARAGNAHNAAADLGGTSWQLVKFQSSDEKTVTPDNQTKYTLQFNTDSSLSARITVIAVVARGNRPKPVAFSRLYPRIQFSGKAMSI